MTDETVYLTTNQVIAINTLQIRLYSPQEQVGVKDPGLLDSAINRPRQSLFGRDAYPSFYEKAAALYESLAKKSSVPQCQQTNGAHCTHRVFEGQLLPMDGGH